VADFGVRHLLSPVIRLGLRNPRKKERKKDLLQNSPLWARDTQRGCSPRASRAPQGSDQKFPRILAAFFPVFSVIFEIGRLPPRRAFRISRHFCTLSCTLSCHEPCLLATAACLLRPDATVCYICWHAYFAETRPEVTRVWRPSWGGF